MVNDNSYKKLEREIRRIYSILRDMDMKLNHIIERLKNTYSFLNGMSSALNSK